MTIPQDIAWRIFTKGIARENADVVHTDWRKLVERGDGSFALGDIKRPDIGAIATDAETETARAAPSTFANF